MDDPPAHIAAEGETSEAPKNQPPDLAPTISAGAQTQAGAILGAYHLLELIGYGGMGEVWLAEQRFPLRRRVALKLIKAGMDTRQVVARFESERQALALMDHPAIAKVFEAGSTPEGRPYFAMEYVSGVPIDVYCDDHKLTVRERLELLIRVCDGVQHAHQKAIIHRDLKPSNILVTEVDGRPAPKIIDFGIAKATAQRLTSKTIFTRLGTVLGTPEYMSPEQASSGGEDVDTRTDVYSLGVILYELMVGVLPFDFRKLAFDQILHQMRHAEVTRPSTKLRTLGEQSATAENRRTEIKTLLRQLRGDLDAVAMKALEKDRSRRYTGVSELANDLERYLRNEPVAAHAPTVFYRARKYMQRHRAAVAAAMTLVLLLAGFAVIEAVQLRRITRERDRADRVTDFMTRMFRISDPSESRGNKVTVREILDKASNDINTGLAGDPDLQAQMMDVMGTVYNDLGLYRQSESLLRKALDIRLKAFGVGDVRTAKSMNDLADTLSAEARHSEAAELYTKAIDVARRTLGPENRATLSYMNNQAANLADEGRFQDAEKLHRQVLAARRRTLGNDNEETLTSIANLGATLDDEGHYAQAEQLNREAVETSRRVLGPDHPLTLRAMHHLANVLYDEGKYAETEQLDREMLESRRRVLGPEHADTLNAMVALANTLDGEGRLEQAEKLDREAVAIQRRVLGPEHPDTLLAMDNLAGILADEHQYAAAEKLQRDVAEMRSRVLGPEHPGTLYSMYNLATTLMLEGRLDEAETMSLKVRDLQRRVLGPDHPDTAETTYNLACIAARRGKNDDAFSLLQEALQHGLKPSVALEIASDASLKPLRTDARFSELVRSAQQSAAAASKTR